MPITQSNINNKSEIERPTCKICGSQMWLRRVAEHAAALETRTFECPVCEVSVERPKDEETRVSQT